MTRLGIDFWHTHCVKASVRLLLGTILFVFLLSMAVVPASAGTEVPFQFRDGFIWLQVPVKNRTVPLNFLLDTGASVSVVDLSTARQLGLRLGGPVRVKGVDSATEGYWPEKLAARLGDVPLPKNYLAIDLTELGASCSTPVDGLLGADFFEGKAVQIDFVSQKIRLLETREAKQIDGEVLPLEMRRCGICVPVAVNGGEARRMRLDTGCVSAMHWVTSDVSPENCTRRIAIGLTEFSLPSTHADVSLGSLTFQDVPADIYTEAIFPGEAGLLGNGLLARFARVTIDTRSKRLVLSHELNPHAAVSPH